MKKKKHQNYFSPALKLPFYFYSKDPLMQTVKIKIQSQIFKNKVALGARTLCGVFR
jgi:hypothetical protein